jgi:N-acyl-D-amino-acid deacylase
MGPLNEEMKEEMIRDQGDIKFDIAWNTLGEYLKFLEDKGVSPNITSFIGTATVRQYILGMATRLPDEEELEQMRTLVRQAMEEGAVGVSSALIYVPGSYAKTDELIELAKTASSYGGMYISHIRSEEGGMLDALGELIYIAKAADIPAEVYHFKASGKANWNKLDTAIQMIKDARKSGLHITSDMYTYRASSTGLNTVLPDWALEGGIYKTIERFKDPEMKAKILNEIDFRCPPDSILLVGFKNPELRHLNGKSLGEIARGRGITDEEAVAELIVEDNSRIQAVFFTMSEDNVKKKIALPFMSFCSDAGSIAAEGVFLNSSVHPRTYGSFARFLGKYVRDEKIIPLKEAIRRLTSFPAENLKIKKRGRLKEGYYADVVVFDPLKIQDHATFQNPHQYATGMKYVWVNGVQVLKDGEHTGALPGRVVHGPGWKGL